MYIPQARQLRFYLSKKARHLKLKHVSVVHNIYKLFNVTTLYIFISPLFTRHYSEYHFLPGILFLSEREQ